LKNKPTGRTIRRNTVFVINSSKILENVLTTV